MEWRCQMASKQIKIIAVRKLRRHRRGGLKEGLPWIRAALAKRMFRGGKWGDGRKGDLTTPGTLKRSLTSCIKLRHCNCRRRRHCGSAFLPFFPGPFLPLLSFAHSLNSSNRPRYQSRPPFTQRRNVICPG